jgi:hypothetical protein
VKEAFPVLSFGRTGIEDIFVCARERTLQEEEVVGKLKPLPITVFGLRRDINSVAAQRWAPRWRLWRKKNEGPPEVVDDGPW